MSKIEILYEDSNYIGFFKPANIPTTYGAEENCFIKIVKETHPELFTFTGFKEEEGGLLYRLDNETSGLLLFAKNKEAFDRFINDKNLEKIYLAETVSLPEKNSGIINFPIAHKSLKKMVALKDGKDLNHRGKPLSAETKYETFPSNQHPVTSTTFLKCFIKKGVRHQIRVHLAAIDCPIIGDDLYDKFLDKEANDKNLHLACIGIKSDFLEVDVMEELKGLVEWI